MSPSMSKDIRDEVKIHKLFDNFDLQFLDDFSSFIVIKTGALRLCGLKCFYDF